VAEFLTVFLDVIRKLEQKQIPYMVVGSIASTIYGEPRLTHDMDVVIDILPAHISDLELLFPLESYYCPPQEILKSELTQRGQFNLLHHQSGLKIDFMIRKNSAHSIEEFRRKQKVDFIAGQKVYVACPEDIIIKKLVFYREGLSDKHLKDIRGIIAHSKIDQNYLQHWINELKLENEYSKV
jgi:hypothetical protein